MRNDKIFMSRQNLCVTRLNLLKEHNFLLYKHKTLCVNHIIVTWPTTSYKSSVVDPRWERRGAPGTHLPWDPIILIFMQFTAKIGQNIRLAPLSLGLQSSSPPSPASLADLRSTTDHGWEIWMSENTEVTYYLRATNCFNLMCFLTKGPFTSSS